jgi:ATP-binding protein involved in chromosome partitioning
MSLFSSLKSVFQPNASVSVEKVAEVLAMQHLPQTTTPVDSLISQTQLVGDVLSLTIKLPVGYKGEPQDLHHQLSEALHPIGVNEVNLHLITQKAASDSPAKPKASLPPVVDAGGAQKAEPTRSEAVKKDERGSSEAALHPSAMSQATLEASSAAVQREEALTNRRPAPPTQTELKAHPRIKQVIVVASGKGGVGKSTTTVNLALALQQLGHKVGVLDADIYGPSVPTMLGTAGKTPLIENEHFVPLEAYGLAVLSIGNLTGDDTTPIVWRGPKATGALMQLFNQTLWPDLDYLLIDMPPGTGDIQLTLAQRIPVSGAVIVTTPQHIALMDAQKGIELFRKVNIPVLGVVENMSTHVCSNCGHVDEIFGTGGGEKLSEAYQVALLGRLPLNADIRLNADQGKPSVVAQDAAAPAYLEIAKQTLVQLEKLPSRERDDKRIF